MRLHGAYMSKVTVNHQKTLPLIHLIYSIYISTCPQNRPRGKYEDLEIYPHLIHFNMRIAICLKKKEKIFVSMLMKNY